MKQHYTAALSLLAALFSFSLSAQTYCTPGYTSFCTSGDYINLFTTTGGVTNVNNVSSGCNGNPNNYIDYSATQFVTTSNGSTINFTLQSGSSWDQGFRVWVDYNDNGLFTDPGEDVWNSGFSSTSAFNGSFTVPVAATAGATLIRVRCTWASVPSDPCVTMSFGETEDYGLILCTTPGAPTTTSPVQGCDGTTATLTASAASGVITWWANSTGGTPLGTGSSYTTGVLSTGTVTYYVSSVNGGCESSRVPVVVNVNPTPSVPLGPDTSVCGGITLDAGNPGSAYLWSTGAGSQTISVTQSGTYGVTVQTTAGCIGQDNVIITVNPFPVYSLGNDTTSCSSSVTLDAGSGWTSYSWSTGSTTQTTSVTSSDTVAVTITDANGCPATDSVIVSLSPAPAVNLGADTTRCGGSVTLDAGNPGSLFFWSDNTSAQTTTVSTSGTYNVYVVTQAGCTNSDTINVTINNQPDADLGADTAICGSSITLDAGNPGSTYAWSTSANTQLVTVGSGTYSVTVTDPSGCADSDTITVTTNATPSVSAGPDVSICPSQSTNLSASGALSYIWSNNAQTSSTSVSPSVSTSYYVTGYDANGCSASDVVIVTVLPMSNAQFTANVVGATGIFTNQSTNAVTYSWNFGDSSPLDNTANPTHDYTSNGTYTVTLTVTGPCGTDTYTQVITITQVGMQDTDLANTLSLFPNPNDGMFTLSFSFEKAKDVTVEVLDVTGRLVYSDRQNGITLYNKQIGIENADQGMYMVRIITTEGVATQKIIIQR